MELKTPGVIGPKSNLCYFRFDVMGVIRILTEKVISIPSQNNVNLCIRTGFGLMFSFADDTELIAENKEDLQKLLDIVEEESRKKGLGLDDKKKRQK